MTIYFVGDVQGCFSELKSLLDDVNFDTEKDQLWLTGDLVARGTQSLETLRFLYKIRSAVRTVLGNHDLHLIATYYGLKKAKPADKLDTLLNAPDADKLISWLIKQPLLRKLPDEETYMSHAGIPPQWSIKKAIKAAQSAEKKLRSEKFKHWLKLMYGNKPNNWTKCTDKEEKFRFTINAFTRMRFCYANGSLDFDHKLAKALDNPGLHPWFELSKPIKKVNWVFGHWAALMGECPYSNVYALDTGCVWGNHMTMLRWHDKRVYTKPAFML